LPLETAIKSKGTIHETPSKFVHSGKKLTNLESMPTTKSNLFTPFTNGFDDDIRFSAVLSKYKRGKDEDNHFPVELINPEPGYDEPEFHKGKSQFEVKQNLKKQREQ
jgi:ATP adenylyltransferase/5',5'''-P-1,P-4-tetraphosphate phosphorylase II